MEENALLISLVFWTSVIFVFWNYGFFRGAAFTAIVALIFFAFNKLKK